MKLNVHAWVKMFAERHVFAFRDHKMTAFFEAHPKQYWSLMLAAAAFLLVLTCAFAIGIFLAYSRAIDTASGTGFDITKVVIDRSSLSDVVKILDERDAQFQRVLAAPTVSDPSL